MALYSVVIWLHFWNFVVILRIDANMVAGKAVVIWLHFWNFVVILRIAGATADNQMLWFDCIFEILW